MAWLEDLARGARLKSLGGLARAATSHEAWPSDESANPRTVENMLRLMDGGERKGQVWLDRRPAVREVLAELLRVDAESLDPGLRQSRVPADPRFRLDELREAAPIDLRHESLFPGIPASVLDPTSWGLLWWTAPGGAGKTLVGRWLEARRLAAFISSPRLDDATARLPEEGPVFIELTAAHAETDPEALGPFSGRRVCVAAAFPPPSAHAGTVTPGREVPPPPPLDGPSLPPSLPPLGWKLIETPAKEEWVEPLAHWVGRRMRAHGGYDAEAILDVVRRPEWEPFLDTPGDYLGICGVGEKLGASRIDPRTPEKVAVAFLESRIQRSDLGRSPRWKPGEVWRLVCGCAEAALLHSGTADAFASELPLRELLPPHALPERDDSVVTQLVDGPGPADMEEFHLIIARARPTIDGAIRELFRLHLLEAVGEGMLVLRPTWLAALAAKVALEGLVREPGVRLGQVLLHPVLARHALPTLRDALVKGAWATYGRVTSGVNAADAASVALVEATFQAAGIALLDSGISAPIPLLRALWDAQMALAIRRYQNAPPQPRLFRVGENDSGWEAAWYVAAVAISERLVRAGESIVPSALAPWGAESPPEFFEQALYGFHRACILPRRSPGDRWSGPPDFNVHAWRLAGRLFRQFGAPPDDAHTRLLYAPFILFESIRAGGAPDWRGRVAFDYELNAMEALASDEELAMDGVLAAAWRTQKPQNEPLLAPAAGLSDAWHRRVWTAMPPDLLATELRSWIHHPDRLAWHRLTPAHWDVVLDVWRTERTWTRHGLHAIPEAQARLLLRDRFGGFGGQVYQTLWDRFPERCIEQAADDVRHPTPDAFDGVLWSTPAHRVAGVIKRVQVDLAAVLATPDSRDLLTRWLHQQVANRGIQWMIAWELLVACLPPALSDELVPA